MAPPHIALVITRATTLAYPELLPELVAQMEAEGFRILLSVIEQECHVDQALDALADDDVAGVIACAQPSDAGVGAGDGRRTTGSSLQLSWPARRVGELQPRGLWAGPRQPASGRRSSTLRCDRRTGLLLREPGAAARGHGGAGQAARSLRRGYRGRLWLRERHCRFEHPVRADEASALSHHRDKRRHGHRRPGSRAATAGPHPPRPFDRGHRRHRASRACPDISSRPCASPCIGWRARRPGAFRPALPIPSSAPEIRLFGGELIVGKTARLERRMSKIAQAA